MLKTFNFLGKSIFFNTFLVVFLFGLTTKAIAQTKATGTFGSSFTVQKSVSSDTQPFQNLKGEEKKETQLSGEITEVCQAKGCWMKVKLTDNEEVFVRFKDYGFFVPTDAAGSSVVMNGNAFVEEMSVEDQQHYAMDKGATEEEAKKITQPKRTLRFEANGVIISN